MENTNGFTLNVNGTIMLLSLIEFALQKGEFFSADQLLNVGVLVEQAKTFINNETTAAQAEQSEQPKTTEIADSDGQKTLDI